MEGLIDWTAEQQVLGADNPMLVVDISTTPDPEPENSRFIFVRIQPEWTCEEILNQAEF